MKLLYCSLSVPNKKNSFEIFKIPSAAPNVATAASLGNTSTVHIPGIGTVQILNMTAAPQQFAINGVPGLPAGAQILSPTGAQFQTGQFATAATLGQPTMQQALQQDPQDPTKWHVVQVATAPTLAAAPATTLQTMQETLAGNSATHTAQLVTTVSAASLSNERNGIFEFH